jgi:hypothetical protein
MPEAEEKTPPADAEASDAPASEDAGSTVESEDLSIMVMVDAAGDRAAGATKIIIDGLQGDEITLTAEMPEGEPFVIALPAEEVARRAADIAGEEPDADAEEEPAEGEE